MLDDAERDVLRETERLLARDDPALDRALSTGRPRSRRVLAIVLGVAGGLLVAGLLALALVGEAVVVSVLTWLVVLHVRTR